MVALVLALVPIPWIVFSPSPPRPIAELVVIEGAERPLSGDLMASSAGFRKATPALALWALVDPGRDLQGRRDIRRFHSVTPLQEALGESVLAAGAVGMTLAGRDATVSSDGLHVISVAPDDPAADVLRSGDVLLEADGVPLLLPSDLRGIAVTSSSDTLAVTLRRGSTELQVDVPIHVTEQRRRVEASTVAIQPRLQLPDGVAITATELEAVGGSAGLMLSLAVYDRFASAPLLNGRRVTGTGSVDRFGTVHRIDGIAQKVRAAEAAGVEIFLAPAAQFEEALAASSGDVHVVSVGVVAEAIEFLRGS